MTPYNPYTPPKSNCDSGKARVSQEFKRASKLFGVGTVLLSTMPLVPPFYGTFIGFAGYGVMVTAGYLFSKTMNSNSNLPSLEGGKAISRNVLKSTTSLGLAVAMGTIGLAELGLSWSLTDQALASGKAVELARQYLIVAGVLLSSTAVGLNFGSAVCVWSRHEKAGRPDRSTKDTQPSKLDL